MSAERFIFARVGGVDYSVSDIGYMPCGCCGCDLALTIADYHNEPGAWLECGPCTVRMDAEDNARRVRAATERGC